MSVICLLLAVCLYGNEADEIRATLSQKKAKVKLAALARLCELSLETDDYQEQWRCQNDYYQETVRQGDVKEQGDAIMMRTILFYNNVQNDSIYYYTRNDLRFLEKHKLWEQYYRVWSYLANTYVYADSVTIGLKEAEAMYDDARGRDNQMGQGLAYAAMGNAHFNLNDMEQASSAYERAIKIMVKLKPVPQEMPNLFSSLCDVLERQKEYHKLNQMTTMWRGGLYQFLEDWKIPEDHPGIAQAWAYYYIGCAQASLGLGQLQRASEMLDEAKKKIVSEDDNTYCSWLFYKIRLCQKQQDYKEALALSDQLYRLSENSEDRAELLRVKQQRAELLSSLGHDKEAAQLYREMYELNDSLNLLDTKQQLAQMNSRFHVDELEMKQARMKVFQAEQERMGIIIIASIIVVALVIFFSFRLRSTKRLKLAHEKLLTAYDQLEETTAAKERIESDLRIARSIQMGMVPHTFPEREDVDLYASMTPAKEVGGDLYDYLIIGDNLFFCIGDVSGKGVPASLFMAMARNLFHVLAQQQLSPSEIATRLNATLSEDNKSLMFVTMFIGVVDLSTGHLEFCNAGHNPPVFFGDGNSEFIKMIPNIPIGLDPGLTYKGEEIADITNRPLFFYTDGLNEAENRDKKEFSDERLLAILAAMPFESSKKSVELLKTEVERYRDGAEPNDDLTMLCVKVIRNK